MLSAVFLCWFAPLAVAADHAAALKDYLTDDVVAVAYLDLSAIDTHGTLKWAEELGLVTSEDRADLAKIQTMVQGRADELADLGASHCYLLFRVSDVGHRGPSWVVPITKSGKPKWEEVPWMPQFWEVVDGALLGGMTEAQLEHLKNTRPTTPRDLSDAWAALGQGDCGLMIVGDRNSRRVVREMFPPLPEPFGAINGKLIADGLLWGGVSLKLPPQPAAEIVVETRDTRAATTVAEAMTSGLALAKQILPFNQVLTKEDREALAHAFRPQVEGARVRIALGELTNDVQLLTKLLSPPVREARQAAHRNQRMNQFKNIALAFHNYADRYKTLPAHANYDDNGKPLLSWRVHLLPYLDQSALYKQFHLDEPWDSKHNRPLAEILPAIYADPDSALRRINAAGKTTFVVPVSEGMVFGRPEGTKFKEIIDGTSNTIMFVEVVPERAVIWTKPDDWKVNLDDPWQGVRRDDRDWFTTGFCDGHAKVFDSSLPAKKLRALLTRAGKEIIEWP
ncbi:MAG: DUF1559 domain-containing protein [Planctomycetes bacterium]|nr:DUF1559 domain-containing protein [Planctomycetota bacterium]